LKRAFQVFHTIGSAQKESSMPKILTTLFALTGIPWLLSKREEWRKNDYDDALFHRHIIKQHIDTLQHELRRVRYSDSFQEWWFNCRLTNDICSATNTLMNREMEHYETLVRRWGFHKSRNVPAGCLPLLTRAQLWEQVSQPSVDA
jgi:hypothetical protein